MFLDFLQENQDQMPPHIFWAHSLVIPPELQTNITSADGTLGRGLNIHFLFTNTNRRHQQDKGGVILLMPPARGQDILLAYIFGGIFINIFNEPFKIFSELIKVYRSAVFTYLTSTNHFSVKVKQKIYISIATARLNTKT